MPTTASSYVCIYLSVTLIGQKVTNAHLLLVSISTSQFYHMLEEMIDRGVIINIDHNYWDDPKANIWDPSV